MDLSAITQQLSSSHCEGTPFPTEKQQILGKSRALTTAASVTAVCGSSRIWGRRFSECGNGRVTEPTQEMGRGTAGALLCCPRGCSEMVLLGEIGSGFAAAPGQPGAGIQGRIGLFCRSYLYGDKTRLATTLHRHWRGRTPLPPNPIRVSGLDSHKGSSCIPAQHQTPSSVSSPSIPVLSPRSPPRHPAASYPCSHPGSSRGDSCQPPAQPGASFGGQTRAARPGPGHGGGCSGWGGGGLRGHGPSWGQRWQSSH